MMRQKRYDSAKAIIDNTAELTDKKANIVYTDGRVFFGTITQIDGEYILLKNMRLKTSKHELSAISELLIDSKA